ncbi:MAG: hypothetical protein IPM29_06575 [Planctomycetes bacterium]|nr:hypothetical protein [Planctomycetota bacterium]
MLARITALVLLGIGIRAQELAVPEFAMPEFDVADIRASVVLSVPEATGPLPLLVDLHGAIAPSRRGAVVTHERLWSAFVQREPWLVAGLNGRTRSWGQIDGEHDDIAYALRALALVRDRCDVAAGRVYLAGFSSGADFLCRGGLQATGAFAGSLVVCPGPPNVVGLDDGALLRAKDHPFVFVTGEEDYIRKAGAWRAFVALDDAGGRALYREVPGLGHTFPPADEYARALHRLEVLAGRAVADPLAEANAAHARGDYLLATTLAADLDEPGATELRSRIAATGRALLAAAELCDPEREPGRTYEAWWLLRTQFHRFPELARRAQRALDDLERSVSGGDLLRARRAWFESRGEARPSTGPWTFDRYLSADEVETHLRDLAARFPERVRLLEMGRSIEGRAILAVEITDRSAARADEKPAAYVQGGLHGNEASSVMNVLWFAWQMGANEDHRRSVDRLLRDVTFYAVPAVDPDALQHWATEPHSPWRPRFNYRPDDADSDGRTDEDGCEDLDGDGEIGLMYRPDPAGPFVLRDGRLVRAEGAERFALVGREGLDDDGDGRFSEDPAGGVDLNRNFPVGWHDGRSFGGDRGTSAGSEPETAAVMRFVAERPNIALFVDYHNAARCLFYWLGAEGDRDAGDRALYEALAGRAAEQLGYAPRPLTHAGAGLAIAWAYGARGIPAAIVELEVGPEPDEAYLVRAWQGDAFVPARPFEHPQLGAILLGGDHRKVAKRNPHPRDIVWQASRNWDWLRAELQRLPRLGLDDPDIRPDGDDFVVTGALRNVGELPLDTERAERVGIAVPVRIHAEGARAEGDIEIPAPSGDRPRPFTIRLREPQASVTLVVAHPRGGTLRLDVRRPRQETVPVRRDYRIEPGYRTVDHAVAADNDCFVNGVAADDRGPAFTVPHRRHSLRVGVLLGEWSNRRHSVPAAAFEDALFASGGFRGDAPTGQPVYGSLDDFYREMSYGTFGVTGHVFDWVELPGSYDDYRAASFGASKTRDALEAAVLARDGTDCLDGFDGLIFVWAGNPVSRVSNLWPMRVPLRHRPGVVAFKMGELYRGHMTPIGVACHELGHTFGVDDKYGLGAPDDPLGPWCLMCRGTHGAGDSAERRPFHLCAWCKFVIGWVHPVVIDPAVPQRLALRPILFGPRECFRVLLTPDGSEYLLLENRRREGFLTDLPSAGLVVLRVGPNDLPGAPQKRVQLLPAHGLPSPSRADVAEPASVAWPQPGHTELVVAGVRIGAIRLVDDVVYFEVGRVTANR